MLDDTQYLRVFEAFSILAKKTGKQSLGLEQIYSIAEEALRESGYTESASAWMSDIVDITCLLVRDGEEHRFIHKTVQEYHTAVFVKRKLDSWVREFYRRILAVEGELG